MLLRLLVIATSLFSINAANGAAADAASSAGTGLTTVAERSGFVRTGRYDEVITLCAAFQKAWPSDVHCVEFGKTPEGRPMQALIVTRSGVTSPEQAAQRHVPVVLIQGGIHAGEIDGKDAGFLLLRELLEAKTTQGPLQKQVIVFVPVFNVDGHERFGRWNRPNQRGPEEMGWRTTAQNINLNRDYVKADAPEMQAMLRLVNQWDPLLYVDLHVTDGAKFEHDVSVQVEPAHAGDTQLQRVGNDLREAVLADLTKAGSLPLGFYPSFVVNDDPASGFEDGVPTPRFSSGYFQLRNRFGMLVETHSWKDYATRVRVTHNALTAVLGQLDAHGAAWLQIAHDADQRASALGGQDVALDFKATDKVRTVDFRGYAYTRTQSDISGALATRYDDTRPTVLKLPLRDDIQASLTLDAPAGGYVVPAAFASLVGAKLEQHGLRFTVMKSPARELPVKTFRAGKVTFAPRSFEGHQTATFTGEWRDEKRTVLPGSLFVPIAQPRARLVMALLEPQAPDSLAAWGEFNNAFEEKEYMEAYVAEDVAIAQMKANPELAAAFRARVAEDADFARDPEARLRYFTRRHPSYDERLNLYPVLRTASVLN